MPKGHPAPLAAVRRHCLSCCNGSFVEVKLCPATACPLWPFRHGRRPSADDRSEVANRKLHPQERHLTGNDFRGTALRAIRLRCLDCSGNNHDTVRSCEFGPDHRARCDLHVYRLGRNPNITRSEEWKAAAAERLRLARTVAASKNPMETPDLSSDRGSDGGEAPSRPPPEKSGRSIGVTSAIEPPPRTIDRKPMLDHALRSQGSAAPFMESGGQG
jgi:hypothetical protein